MEGKRIITIEINDDGYIINTKNLWAGAPSLIAPANIQAVAKITETLLQTQKDVDDKISFNRKTKS